MKTTKLVVISDTHCTHDDLILPNAEILVHAGDWTYYGRQDETINFLVWAQLQTTKYRLVICGFGNHEKEIEEDFQGFRELQREYAPDVKFLNMNSFTDKVSGLKFFGYPYVPYINGRWAFEKHRGKEIKAELAKIPQCDVLISHGPPWGVLDEMEETSWVSNPSVIFGYKKEKAKVNIGCQDLLEEIHRIGCKTVLFGHIHEDGGKTLEKDGITYVNAAVLDENYILVNQPSVVYV